MALLDDLTSFLVDLDEDCALVEELAKELEVLVEHLVYLEPM